MKIVSLLSDRRNRSLDENPIHQFEVDLGPLASVTRQPDILSNHRPFVFVGLQVLLGGFCNCEVSAAWARHVKPLARVTFGHWLRGVTTRRTYRQFIYLPAPASAP